MTSTHDKWQSLGISNAHNLVGKYRDENPGVVGVYLSRAINDGSRMSMGAPHGVQVIRPGFKTDPEGNHWRNGGHKTFSLFSHDHSWDVAYAEAIAWVVNRYKVSAEFVPITGFGTARFPVAVAEWAKAYLKENYVG